MDATTQKALKGYRNIALFGVDSRDGSLQTGARSDSIMVISINQETKDVKITSIYRDTCLKVPGYGFSKATHAYAYGGAELSMSMLNTNLDLDITEDHRRCGRYRSGYLRCRIQSDQSSD